MDVGERLKQLRKETGTRQKDLADFLQISASAVSHYESGKNLPDAFTLVKLADFFGVSIDYMLGRSTLRLDWKSFQRSVNLVDGSTISLEKIVFLFLKLSEESQTDIIKLIRLYLLSDQIRHQKLRNESKKARAAQLSQPSDALSKSTQDAREAHQNEADTKNGKRLEPDSIATANGDAGCSDDQRPLQPNGKCHGN